MSLKALMKEAGVSTEDYNVPGAHPVVGKPAKEDALVEETVVSPVDSPSASIDVVVEPTETVTTVVEPVESVVAPVEVVPVADVTQAVTEAVEITQIEAKSQAIEAEQCAIKEKADELLEIQTALESMADQVRSYGAKGISNATAKAIQSHLKTISRQLGVTSDFVSVESFSAKDIREEHSQAQVALESIKTTAKVAKNRFLELVRKIIALFKKIVMNQLDGINALEREARKLDTELAQVKATGGDGEIQLKSAGLLMQDGEVQREIGADIQGLAHFSAVAYPEAVIKFLDGLTKGVLKFDPEGAGMDELEAFFEQYSKPLKFLIDQKITDEQLPGGYTLDVADHGMSVGIKAGDATDSETTIDVLPTIKLRKVVRDVISTLDQMREIRPEVDKISKAGDRLVEAVERAAKKHDDSNEKAYEEMSDRVAKIVADSSPRIGEVIGYLVRYLKLQLVVTRAQLDHIKSNKD